MPFELPNPPPGSWFRIDRDAQGQPRLTWRESLTWWVYLGCNAILLGFTAAAGWFVYKVFVPMLNLWNVVPQAFGQNVVIDVILVLGFGMLMVGVVGAAFALASMESVVFHLPQPERLTFGPLGLRYEFEGGLWFLRRQVREIPREEMGAVRLGSVMTYQGAPPRQRLAIDHGAEPVEIGKTLQEPDRQWLAQVLRDWASERQPPAHATIPELPQNALITLTRNDERLTLRWRPCPPGSEELPSGRWVTLLQLSVFFCFWALFELLITIQVIAILMGRWQAWGGIQWIMLGIMLLWLSGWTVGGLSMMQTFWTLLRRPMTCLTLTSTLLEYRPGPYFGGRQVCTDPPRAIPRSEIGSIQLEQTENGQHLTVGHGQDRIEIGQSLREPEREWLANVLQAWATQPRLVRADTSLSCRETDPGRRLPA